MSYSIFYNRRILQHRLTWEPSHWQVHCLIQEVLVRQCGSTLLFSSCLRRRWSTAGPAEAWGGTAASRACPLLAPCAPSACGGACLPPGRGAPAAGLVALPVGGSGGGLGGVPMGRPRPACMHSLIEHRGTSPSAQHSAKAEIALEHMHTEYGDAHFG